MQHNHNAADLILIDEKFVNDDKNNLIDDIKENEQTSQIPIITMASENNLTEISVQSITKGAVDCITKPVNEFDPEQYLQQNQQQKTILIADDDELIHDLLCGSFERIGYQTVRASNGNETLQLINQHKPDMVILDFMMPGMDGISVLKQIKKNPDYKSIPVIMLTAKNQQENIIKGLNNGAADYITKPFDISEVQARVTGILQRN